MTLDLILLAIVLIAGVLGAIAGAARQIAQLVALVVAYLCARPLGAFTGPRFAHLAGLPELFGLLFCTLFAFIAVMVVVRWALTRFLKRMLTGKSKEDRGPDRALGFALGALKVILIAYVMLSGLTFVEDHVSVAGRRLGMSPKDSFSFAFARRHNLFELTVFSPVRDLIAIAQDLGKPGGPERLMQSPAYRSLLRDPRFQRILKDHAMQRALRSGDSEALLRNDIVMQLVRDREAAAKLAAAVSAGS